MLAIQTSPPSPGSANPLMSLHERDYILSSVWPQRLSLCLMSDLSSTHTAAIKNTMCS